jgi:DNA-binding MarR family transcriptional regulator
LIRILSCVSESTSSLQREICQSRPFRSLGHEAAVSLLRTADLVRRTFQGVLEPFDLTLQQYNVLRILRGAEGSGIPTLEIGERMIEHAPGVTRLIDRLEAKGLVRRERCPEDRRQVLCYSTPEGRDLVDRLEGAIDVADEAAVASLSPAEQRQLIGLLDLVRAAHPSPDTGCPGAPATEPETQP